MDPLLGYELGLYGEIDKQVVRAKAMRSAEGDRVVDTVERLLPNTTGFGQAGWYEELSNFINDRAVGPSREPILLPDLRESLSYMEMLTLGASDYRAAVPTLSAVSTDVLRSAPQEFAVNYVATGAAYPAFVLEKIRRAQADQDGLLAEPLDLLERLPSFPGGTAGLTDSPRFVTSGDILKLRADIDRINVRGDWQPILAAAGIDEEFAKKSESCFGLLEEADGQYCGSVYTDYTERDLTIEDVTKVLQPRNWPHCSNFFHDVCDQEPKYVPTGWSRILEVISPEPEKYLLNTALIFYFGKFDNDGGIYLNYDIDKTKQRDSFLVHVDSGFICLTKPTDGGPGVRIRTSKQERVDGLSPTATSALACHMGWGQLARDMLAGAARLVRDGTIKESNLTKFEFSPPKPSALKANSGPVPTNDPKLQPVRLPGNFRDTLRDTQVLANDLITRVTDVWGSAAQRWMDGMTREDIAATTGEIGDNLSQFAQDVYTTAENDFKGKPEKQNGGHDG